MNARIKFPQKVKVKKKVHSLAHGDQDSLQRLHLLCQHSIFYTINAFQSPIISSILNHLNNILTKTILKRKLKILCRRREAEDAKRNSKTCNLWMIEEALENWEINLVCSSFHRPISSFTLLNFCWYFFTIDSIFSQTNWLQKDQCPPSLSISHRQAEGKGVF